MQLYNFEVVKNGSVIQTQAIHLPDVSCAWPAIKRLANRFRQRGYRFRVKDQAGGNRHSYGRRLVRHHEGIRQSTERTCHSAKRGSFFETPAS